MSSTWKTYKIKGIFYTLATSGEGATLKKWLYLGVFRGMSGTMMPPSDSQHHMCIFKKWLYIAEK